jgi:Arc-like DNA binding domain
MSKRKKTDIVSLKLRIREALRKRLETAASGQERSLNSEMAARLEESFLQGKNTLLLEALLAPGVGLELLRAVAIILRQAGPDWNVPPKSHTVADAINKIIAVLNRELRPNEASFPERKDKSSSDQLAWIAVLAGRFFEAWEAELKGEKS